MGAGPELNGFTTWGSQKPDLPSRVLNEYGMFPTIFSLLREQKPKLELGYIYEWDGMSYLVEKDALNFSKHTEGGNQITTNAAVAYIYGGKTMQEMQIPFIVSGAGIKQGHRTTASVMQFDTAATLAYIFGVTPPQVWIGRPVTEIFK